MRFGRRYTRPDVYPCHVPESTGRDSHNETGREKSRIRYGCLKLLVLLLLFCGRNASAQYYDWGQDPASVKWSQMKTPDGRIVFPNDFTANAIRLVQYREEVLRHADYGFSHKAMKLPVLVHTRNFSPNGLVMLAPNRIELLTIPPSSTYATPWMKQLIAHESRHAVQYNNLNQGAIKVLGKIFGQHGSIIGLAFLPIWAMEGDATHTETQLTAFGRGLQPSFTIEYRAMMMEGTAAGWHPDKFFSGSFRDYMPDHYQLGYQISTYAYTKYGENVWDKVADYGSRRPYQLFTTHIALKKYYSTSTTKLFYETFDNLTSFWRQQPLADNSSRIISTPVTSYTTYSTPVYGDGSSVYALKKDLDRTSRIVRIDPADGTEKTLRHTGVVNTGLVRSGDKLWWSEYRRSLFWDQKVNSQLCWYDMRTGKKGVARRERRAFFPTPMPENEIAWVEYDYTGRYRIRGNDVNIVIPDTVSVHGLAYDDGQFYFIGLSDSGMWIGTAEPETGDIRFVTQPNYSSISSLTAGGGKLYCKSIASGKDEAHMFDTATGKEYRLTDSRYGSFSPSPSADGGNVAVTTYTTSGYLPAIQSVDSTAVEIPWAKMPGNTVNPPRVKWDVPKIDDFTAQDTTAHEIRRFRKSTHLWRFHSWAPAWFEPENTLGETNASVHLGVTLLSQNMLNTAYTTLGYKYTDDGSFFTANFKYHGLPVKLELEGEYGTMDQLVYISRSLAGDNLILIPRKLHNYFSLTARAYLPFNFDSGHHYRRLVPMVEFEHINSKVYYADEGGGGHFRNGMQKMKFSLLFTDNVRMAHRDFLPRWGYAARVTHTSNPFNNSFGKIWSGYLRAYLPGVMPHHSLMVRSGLQTSNHSSYNWRQKEVFPRSALYNFSPERYGSVAVDYQFPVWCPDGGIRTLLYFKRIRLNMFYDYARFRVNGKWDDIYSYGFDLTFDIVPFRLPGSTNTSVSFSLRNPSNRSGVVFGASISMPL